MEPGRRCSGANGAGHSYHGCVPADVRVPAASSRSGPAAVLHRWAAPVISPTPASLRRLALASVVANVGIVATGAAVRLSNSGLGCLDWPDCTKSSLVAAPRSGEPMFHTWIEFGNRTLTGVLEVIAVLVFIAAWRFRPPGAASRRRDLVLLAAAQPAGVILQALIGGVVVLTGLDPAWVSGHFVLSAVVVAAAVALHARCTEASGPARLLVRRELWLLGLGMLAVVLAMLVAGTIVTGTGPLAGAPGVPRYHLQLQGVTQFHADIGWLLGGVTFALLLGLRLTGAPERILRLGYLLIGLIAAQGLLGYLQYFAHLPAGLVWVHESSSMLIWVVALRLVFALRDRGSITGPAPEPEPADPAARPAPGEVGAPAV
ncbi:MAG: heme A synthase [Actinobacteria bacterium]|nr:heme A synthase [Actinomycetota bacterium]